MGSGVKPHNGKKKATTSPSDPVLSRLCQCEMFGCGREAFVRVTQTQFKLCLMRLTAFEMLAGTQALLKVQSSNKGLPFQSLLADHSFVKKIKTKIAMVVGGQLNSK